MKNVYCTLFNLGYLVRGLALYRSMEKCITSFRLYILAMDSLTKGILEAQNLEHAKVIFIEDILDHRYKMALGDRIGPSFFWTCTPLIIEYVLNAENEQWCTYIDADCFFFGDPQAVFDSIEQGDYAVGIVEHRYRKDNSYQKWVDLDGRFNVAFNTFRNEEYSKRILGEWKDQCLECCTSNPTGKNFGDQLYLNEWPQKYDRVYIVEDDGIDVAPWNVNNYTVKYNGESFEIHNSKRVFEIKMYHFHAISFLSSHLVSLNLWNTISRRKERDLFKLYRIYINEYKKQQVIVDKYRLGNRDGFGSKSRISLKDFICKLVNRPERGLIQIFRNIMWI